MATLTRPLGPILALATLAAAGTGPAPAAPLPERAHAVVDYDIRVRLDAEEKRLSGEERLVWRNPASEPIGELWFHLYLNAFRNSKSTFFRESGGGLWRGRDVEDGWGGIDITSIRRADGVDLAGATSFEHPDDDNDDDRTVLRVRLPEPVPPGEIVTLDLAFEARLPGFLVRTGYVRDYFLVGQWFPKLGVYEPAGTRGRLDGGWNCHQFHSQSEFYADFGDYHVEITLPDRFVVGATGRKVEDRENEDGTTTHVYEQANVHDFAWTADPRFLEVRRTFRADDEVSPGEYDETARLLGRSLEEVRLQDVEVVLLLQPEHAPQRERHIRAAKAALKWYGLWYGRYPHATLTVVDPASGGGGSGGMEYPTLITAGTRHLFNWWPLDRILEPEDVIVHEVGHQYWQGMVASNEFEEPWLDEGFTTYSTAKVLVQEYGPVAAEAFGLRLGQLEELRMSNRARRDFDPIRGPAWDISRDYRFDIYTRTALTLETLERLLGEETMSRVMRTYHERWRFGHPGSEDFYVVASEVAGQDLGWFFERTVERPGFLDYEVASVRSGRDPGPGGILDDGAAATVSLPETADGTEDGNEDSWRSVVLVRRRGELVLPVEVELQFEGAPPERRQWDGRDRWVRYEATGPHRLVAAVVDPDDRLVLDVNRLNNARRAQTDHATATYWGTRWAFWLQTVLSLVGL
ncbi:MAG: M1 family metallopeptidase [Acidobacteria bacterium]|nr:M1 family metallopeptidase [Acidobacteriota bacterium]